MSRLTRLDKLLLGSLLPALLVCFALHVREVRRTGLSQPPVFAVPDYHEGYPRVGGLRLERGRSWGGLEVGDRLLRLGDVDLRGVGYIGFDAIAHEQAGLADRIPVVYERGGQRGTLDLELQRFAHAWFRIPMLLAGMVVCSVVLLRSPGSRQAQFFFTASMGVMLCWTPFLGESRLQNYVSLGLFNFGMSFALYFVLRWLIAFPDEMDPRHRLPGAIAWLAVLHVLTRTGYFFGGPIPPQQTPHVTLAGDAVMLVAVLAIQTWNYRHASPIGRRRQKWFLYGIYLTLLPAAFMLLLRSTGFVEIEWHDVLPVLVLLSASIPVGVLIGIVRYNLFDIDRLFSATAAYSLTAVVAFGAFVAVAPGLAEVVAAATGTPEQSSRLLLAALFALGAVIAGRRVGPRVERMLSPERRRTERGLEQLLGELSRCRGSDDDVLDVVTSGLDDLLRPVDCWLYVPEGEAFRARRTTGSRRLPPLPYGPLLRALERSPMSLRVTPASLSREVPDLRPAERRALAMLEAELLVPVRRGKDLAACAVLTRRRSGDIYTGADLAMLDTVAEKASAELLRLREAEQIAQERARARELEAARREAEQAHEEKSRFLAGASHDLRQPLHALSLLVEALASRVGDDDARRMVERMQSSTAALEEMFDGLLDLSRLEAGGVTPRVTPFPLQPLAERLAAELAAEVREKELQLEVEVGSVQVQSDPTLLSRILQNLLSNAVRYTEKGRVALLARAEGARATLEVVDTGPGIPPERQTEIFREFVQLEPGSHGGLGLGLAIVDRLARLLGHGLDFESVPGVGTSFRLEVPLAEPGSVAAESPGTSATGAAESAVLVVDDDLDVLDGMRRLLEAWGHRVLPARGLEEALDAVGAAGDVDAILADYRLERGETGADVIAQVRERCGREVPAAVISGEPAEEIEGPLRALGVRRFVKPLPPFKLRSVLLELLRDA